MMLLNLKRFWRTTDFTIGALYVDGVFECFTLENPEREVKLEDRTAIPCGTYSIEFTYSPHFNQIMPLLDGVPDYTAVRIHWGNKVEDTEACILVGQTAQEGYISNSRLAFTALYAKIKDVVGLQIKIEDI